MGKTTEIIKEIKQRDPERKGDTLIDLEGRDIDNYEHLLRSTKVHFFSRPKTLMDFINRCLDVALQRCGVDMARIMKHRRSVVESANETLLKSGVRVETRRPGDDDPEARWRNGIYVMKNGEIAYVICDNKENATAPPYMRFQCRTNVPVVDERKTFSLGGAAGGGQG